MIPLPFLAALPWGRIVAGAAIVVAVYGAHALYSGHYRAQGRAEVQGQWDAQKVKDRNAWVASVTAARISERQLMEAAAVTAEKRLGELNHENETLRTSLAARPPERMRVVTVTRDAPSSDTLERGQDRSGDNAACSGRLPAEIGEGFERLRAESLRIGSEANVTAINLQACQERVLQLEGAYK